MTPRLVSLAVLSVVATFLRMAWADCKPDGDVLLEVAQRTMPHVHGSTAKTKVWANGAWMTEVHDGGHNVARTRAGCLDDAKLGRIRARMDSASWKTVRSKRACRSDQPRFTTYTWKGRLVYTERTCNTQVLDADSRKALDAVSVVLGVPLDLDADNVCVDNPLDRGCN